MMKKHKINLWDLVISLKLFQMEEIFGINMNILVACNLNSQPNGHILYEFVTRSWKSSSL